MISFKPLIMMDHRGSKGGQRPHPLPESSWINDQRFCFRSSFSAKQTSYRVDTKLTIQQVIQRLNSKPFSETSFF